MLHDLGLITEGTFVNALFVFVPPILWIAVVLWRQVPSPFLTLLTVGAVYGVFLLLGHQLLWNQAFDGNPAQLGGNLADLGPGTQEVIVRAFSGMSSLVTGLLVGAVTGAVAWAISRVLHRRD